MSRACTIRALACLGLAFAVLASMGAGPSQGPSSGSRPLPSFGLFAPDGHHVSSSALGGDVPWVLIYLKPDGPATPKLLSALAQWALPPDLARRVVLVVQGPLDVAAACLSAGPPSDGVVLAWYADPNGQAAQALALTGAPAIRGVRAGAMHWALDGVLNDPMAYESAIRTWIGAPAAR